MWVLQVISVSPKSAPCVLCPEFVIGIRASEKVRSFVTGHSRLACCFWCRLPSSGSCAICLYPFGEVAAAGGLLPFGVRHSVAYSQRQNGCALTDYRINFTGTAIDGWLFACKMLKSHFFQTSHAQWLECFVCLYAFGCRHCTISNCDYSRITSILAAPDHFAVGLHAYF